MNYIAKQLRKHGINPVARLIAIADNPDAPPSLKAGIYNNFIKWSIDEKFDEENGEQLDLFGDDLQQETNDIVRQSDNIKDLQAEKQRKAG